MKTKILKFSDSQCVDIINSNRVLAFPTETVYGLGVVYDSKDAFDALCDLKKRVPDKPFTIMLSNKEDINLFVNVSLSMQRLIDKFMPGEVTFLFPIKKGLYPWLNLNQPTVGIRISSSKEVTDLIERVGKPMLVTSANMSGCPALNNTQEVLEVFDGKVLGIVEGCCESKSPSTIVLIKEKELELIRQGSVPFEDIKKEYEK